MFKKLNLVGLVVASMLSVSAFANSAALAAPGNGDPGHGPGMARALQPNTPGGPTKPGGAGSSDFTLTGLTVTPNPMMQGSFELDLAVTVEQTQPDGSDFAEDKTATSETHDFPQSIYINVADASGQNVGLVEEPISSVSNGVGITYPKNVSPNPIVSATAYYKLTLPSNVTSGQYTLSLYSSGTKGDTMTFRMGPYSDGSWSDDLVSGTTSISSLITVATCGCSDVDGDGGYVNGVYVESDNDGD